MTEPDMLLLKAEITSDPLGRGYAGMTDAQVAASLNTKNRTRERATLEGSEIYEATIASEFTALTNALQAEVWNMIHMGTVYVSTGKRARARFITIFGAGSATIAALAALVNESISRATELGWDEIKVGWIIMAKAAQ